MANSAGDKRRTHLAATAALLCALVASLGILVTSAAAEEGDSAPLRSFSEDGFVFPAITGPEAPEHYPFSVSLGEEQYLRQLSSTEAEVYDPGHEPATSIVAPQAHDAEGADVPTTLEVTGPEIVTLTVDFRAGNPLAGGAPFDYPVVAGTGWEGGFHTTVVPMVNPNGEAGSAPPYVYPPFEPNFTPADCRVPKLVGLGRRAVAKKLAAAHCTLGEVWHAHGVTAAEGKVVKQFRATGSELTAGTPVAIKIGAR
jgi:hypothetical protein